MKTKLLAVFAAGLLGWGCDNSSEIERREITAPTPTPATEKVPADIHDTGDVPPASSVPTPTPTL